MTDKAALTEIKTILASGDDAFTKCGAIRDVMCRHALSDLDDDGRVAAGPGPGLSIQETLKTYRSARDRIRELVPELVTDLREKT